MKLIKTITKDKYKDNNMYYTGFRSIFGKIRDCSVASRLESHKSRLVDWVFF